MFLACMENSEGFTAQGRLSHLGLGSKVSSALFRNMTPARLVPLSLAVLSSYGHGFRFLFLYFFCHFLWVMHMF